MGQRTTIPAVQAILGSNYGTLQDGVTLPSLQPFIDSASSLVDQCVSFGNVRGWNFGGTGTGLNPAQQELVERWLAAHFYTVMDPLYTTKGQGGASASFEGRNADQDPIGMTAYGRQAKAIDWTGALTAISKRAFARGFHLGPDDLCYGTGLTQPTSLPVY